MMKYKGNTISDCDCGGPQYGTDHAPDCRMILDAEDIDHELDHGDAVRCCPECEKSNQFGELCPACTRDRDDLDRSLTQCCETINKEKP